ncbi:hypothetical protein [Campylobacter sp. 19-13652]|uniref:hypothetical protein n=1 Tax=Campylobacter sp. 19-13652 TaxID=2840180 RepID=UPI001C780BC1|nr:hypothetical protein [Campylobacter sp. 19-13652]BCX78994.1 hypothetical protein LBC_04560 [Campylobacter sp. 19-13652]
MIKTIVALLVVYVLYSLFFKRKNRIQNSPQKDEESFVACKKCGVFVDETSLKNGLCQNCQKEKS